jgi:succinate dehydrogenase/fumarate reductase flavoprotein subunit
MKKFDYHLIVIGGGTAGLITANVAAQAKAKVALVERHLLQRISLSHLEQRQ